MRRIKVTLSLTDEDIERLDRLRGDIPRSDYVGSLLRKHKVPSEISDSKLISEFAKCTSAIKAYIMSDGEDDVKKLDMHTMVEEMTEMMRKVYGRK